MSFKVGDKIIFHSEGTLENTEGEISQVIETPKEFILIVSLPDGAYQFNMLKEECSHERVLH